MRHVDEEVQAGARANRHSGNACMPRGILDEGGMTRRSIGRRSTRGTIACMACMGSVGDHGALALGG